MDVASNETLLSMDLAPKETLLSMDLAPKETLLSMGLAPNETLLHHLRSLIERTSGGLHIENHAAQGMPATLVGNRLKSTAAVCNSRRLLVLGDACCLLLQRPKSALQRLHHLDWADMMHWIHCHSSLCHILVQVRQVRLFCWRSVAVCLLLLLRLLPRFVLSADLGRPGRWPQQTYWGCVGTVH